MDIATEIFSQLLYTYILYFFSIFYTFIVYFF